MRQSQQKNRMRGRGRKQGNPLSRNYESNGPDVKVRGNASHIADKYAALARDAAAAGDVVMSENYLQHAEHYNRIIAAANAANQQRNEEQAGHGQQPDVSSYDGDDDGDHNESQARDSQPRGNRNENRGDNRNDNRGDSRADNRNDSRNATSDGQDEDDRQRERKPRREPRNRRPRRDDETAEADTAKMNGGGSVRANGRGDHAADDTQSGISSDAAKLPGRLMGSVEEDAVAETAGDD